MGDYLRARGLDALDVIEWEIGYPAVGVSIGTTPLLHTGLDLWLATPDYGGAAGTCQSRIPDQADFLAFSAIVWHSRGCDARPGDRDPSDPLDFPLPDAGPITHALALGFALDGGTCPDHLRLARWLDLEVDAAALIGFRVRASPGELVDFILGWFGLDLGRDDAWGITTPGR